MRGVGVSVVLRIGYPSLLETLLHIVMVRKRIIPSMVDGGTQKVLPPAALNILGKLETEDEAGIRAKPIPKISGNGEKVQTLQYC